MKSAKYTGIKSITLSRTVDLTGSLWVAMVLPQLPEKQEVMPIKPEATKLEDEIQAAGSLFV